MDFLIYNNYPRLKARLDGYKKVKIFTQSQVPQWAINKLAENLLNNGAVVSKLELPLSYLGQHVADTLEPSGEDVIIALGSSHIISIAKYYAYCHVKPLVVVPFGEIAEHDFSKYALLKDIKLCFYVCDSPQFVFIDSDFFTDDQIKTMYNNLSYKNVVAFEKEFDTTIYGIKNIDLNSLVNNINNSQQDLHSLATTLATCAVMADEHKTSDIVGNDYLLTSLLAKDGQPFIIQQTAANNLLAKFYDCFFRFDPIENIPNLNLHIMRLKDIYGINFLQGYSLMPPLPPSQTLTNIKGKLNAYFPYLKAKLTQAKAKFVCSSCKFSRQQIASLALAASVSTRPSILTLARDFGYFDPLLKGKDILF